MLPQSNDFYDSLEKIVSEELTKSGGGLKPWTPGIAKSFHEKSIRELIESEYFLNLKGTIYPFYINLIEEIFEESKNRKINLVTLSAGIGSGKNFVGSVLLWLNWYYYTTTPDHKEKFPYFDFKNATVAFILMSRDAEKAKKVVFSYVYPLFQSQFNKEYFPPNPKITSYLDIPRNKTLIFPGTGEAASALGFNIFGSVVDEINYLQGNSAKSSSSAEVEDPAEAMYNQIQGRVYSRFGEHGGMNMFISSANKVNSWMENKIASAMKNGVEMEKIFFLRIPFWKAKPKGFFNTDKEFLFNAVTMEIITDEEQIKQYYSARERAGINSMKINPVLSGLML